MQTPIKDYIEESKKLFDEKLTQYDKDGGFIVYIEGEDCTDFDTDLMLKFLTSRQEGLLEVARGILEKLKYKSYPILTEIESDTAKCVKEIYKILDNNRIHITEDMIKTATMYVELYEEEKKAKYVRYLENRSDEVLSQAQEILKIKE